MGDLVILSVGEDFHLMRGKDHIIYAGMPSEDVYSIVQRTVSGHSAQAWNLFYPRKQQDVAIDGAVNRMTKLPSGMRGTSFPDTTPPGAGCGRSLLGEIRLRVEEGSVPGVGRMEEATHSTVAIPEQAGTKPSRTCLKPRSPGSG